jgi:transposase-like protein
MGRKRYQEMSLMQFQRRFRTEVACREHLFKLRWPDGFVCPVCGNQECYDLPRRNLVQCKACGRQTSVTAGTVMHRTRTPIRIWFWAIYLAANDKRGLSALQVSKKLEVSYYVAWTMLHKIRRAMKERDSAYELRGVIEMDDSFFGSGVGGDKRGRGTKKTPVIIEASTQGAAVGFARMHVVEHVDADTIGNIVQKDIAENQTIKSDGWRAYGAVRSKGHGHHKKTGMTSKEVKEFLGWAHTLASNAKSYLLGTLHGVGKKHLQEYLDEFCYRFNRRNWEAQIFERLVTACVHSKGVTYSELIR